MLTQLSDADRALVDSFDQRRGGRDLEERRMLDPQVISQRCANDMVSGIARFPLFALQRVPQRIG